MGQDTFHMLGGSLPSFPPGEIVLRAGPANHWRGIEAVGGWLTLTNRQLHFRPHAINVRPGDSSLDLAHIVATEGGRSLWIIPNQLVVLMRDGRRERFVVQDRDAWVGAIRAALASTPYR